MAKRHYIPVTSDMPGTGDRVKALVRKAIRTALAAEGVIVAAGNKTFLNLQTIDVLDSALAAYERVFRQMV